MKKEITNKMEKFKEAVRSFVFEDADKEEYILTYTTKFGKFMYWVSVIVLWALVVVFLALFAYEMYICMKIVTI
jgi:hypothetical protein